jgi:uncharacterized protein YjbI with pentapeptide repeats
MANKEHVALLGHGVDAWNRWREQSPGIQPDLIGSSLREKDLNGINFRGTALLEADLSWARINGANLSHAEIVLAHLVRTELRETILSKAMLNQADLSLADLSGADLSEADLSGASLYRGNLNQANFSQAILRRANLSGANLQRANLNEALLHETFLGATDLTQASGLESCRHEGPSTVDFRTLTKSWPLPLAFLRGCGLPDTLINYLPSLLNEPIQFYSCFISYSSRDQEFTERLHADLQNKGVRCWFAPEDIQGGKKTHEQIDQAIRLHEKLLLVLSEHSISSPWVEFEIRRARKREAQEQRRVLFPIRLVEYSTLEHWECFDADTKKDLATEIREYYIPDFSHWKDHHAYQKAFERLLRDLNATEEKKGFIVESAAQA